MNWLRRVFCLHDYEVMQRLNLHRNLDNKVVGHRVVQRCTKCGHIEHKDTP